jgi:hypothetical protein
LCGFIATWLGFPREWTAAILGRRAGTRIRRHGSRGEQVDAARVAASPGGGGVGLEARAFTP